MNHRQLLWSALLVLTACLLVPTMAGAEGARGQLLPHMLPRPTKLRRHRPAMTTRASRLRKQEGAAAGAAHASSAGTGGRGIPNWPTDTPAEVVNNLNTLCRSIAMTMIYCSRTDLPTNNATMRSSDISAPQEWVELPLVLAHIRHHLGVQLEEAEAPGRLHHPAAKDSNQKWESLFTGLASKQLAAFPRILQGFWFQLGLMGLTGCFSYTPLPGVAHGA